MGALALSFLCSILEAVLLSTPLSFISMKENQGNKTATLMKQYKNNSLVELILQNIYNEKVAHIADI